MSCIHSAADLLHWKPTVLQPQVDRLPSPQMYVLNPTWVEQFLKLKVACNTKLRPILTESLPDRLLFELPEKFDSMVNLLEAITFFSDSFPKHMAAVVRKYYDTVDNTITYRSKWTAQSKL